MSTNTKDSLAKKLEGLIDEAKKIEGLAVADAARVENAIQGAYHAVCSILNTEPPKVGEVVDPSFEQISKQTEAHAKGLPNINPLTGEPVPPGSTEGVRPSGSAPAEEVQQEAAENTVETPADKQAQKGARS